jgi:hypothetical protein|tara:strand:- start:594 stop:866 length:273 start_codon:yes stop_codon:yes gene_type:complete
MMKVTLTSAIVNVMSDNKPWTFWSLQDEINRRFDVFYGEPSISAGIRMLRRYGIRKKYNLPEKGEIVFKERIPSRRGYQYILVTNNEETS